MMIVHYFVDGLVKVTRYHDDGGFSTENLGHHAAYDAWGADADLDALLTRHGLRRTHDWRPDGDYALAATVEETLADRDDAEQEVR